MEANARPRLHPLLTAAAISVTVFSAVGVGALTGFLPTSHSTSQETAPLTAAAPAAQRTPQTALPESALPMPAAPAATPAPKPVKKHVARAPAPKPAEPVAPTPEAPQVFAQANIPPPPPAPVEAPRPAVLAGIFGVVQSVKEVSTPAKSNGVGPIAGGIAGALLGNQVGHGTGKTIATVLGAAGGAFAGKEIEQQARASKSWETTVRLDDGSYRTMSSSTAPIWRGGERVRLVDGSLQPA
jgi:outer membrane lipoprotein SlyB